MWQKDLSKAKEEFIRSNLLDSTEINHGLMIELVEMAQTGPNLTIAEHLENLVQVDPQSSVAYLCRGIANWLYNNFKLAIKDFEQACRLDPESEDAYFWKGMTYAALEEDDKAIASFKKALELEMPPILLAPLQWFEKDRPEFYERYVMPWLTQINHEEEKL